MSLIATASFIVKGVSGYSYFYTGRYSNGNSARLEQEISNKARQAFVDTGGVPYTVDIFEYFILALLFIMVASMFIFPTLSDLIPKLRGKGENYLFVIFVLELVALIVMLILGLFWAVTDFPYSNYSELPQSKYIFILISVVFVILLVGHTAYKILSKDFLKEKLNSLRGRKNS